MEYQVALEWIHSRLPLGSRPGLERINALLAQVDNPQNKIKTIHIGGTNGKGSTVTFLRQMLEANQLKVGTFTSPFIVSFNERISINGTAIPDEDLIELVERFQPIVAELDENPALAGATEFEIITAMMFLYFYQQEVDVAIVEVGLGGTYDCTNVITPLLSAITTIGLDHVDILGDSIAGIAAQKAGIIKNQRPIVIGALPTEAVAVIKQKAQEMQSPLYQLGQEFRATHYHSLGLAGEAFSFSNSTTENLPVEVALIGKHQIDNASVAIQAYSLLQAILELPVTVAEAVTVLQNAHWAGRMEVLSTKPLIIIDGAHNEPAMERLVDNLSQSFADKEIITIFSAINTKDISKMVQLLRSLPNMQLHATTFTYPKAISLAEYQTYGFSDQQLLPDWQTAITDIKGRMNDQQVLLITGSLYFISQVREFLLGGA